MLRGKKVGYFTPTYSHQEEVYQRFIASLMPWVERIEARESPHPVIRLPAEGGLLEMWSLASGYSVARGRSYYAAIVDEAAFAPDLLEQVEGAIMPTLLDQNGRLWVASTPWRGGPAFRALWERGEAQGWALYHAPTWENPHIPTEAIEELKAAMDPIRYREEIEAEFVDDLGGGVFPREALQAPGFRVAPGGLPELAVVVVGVDPAIEDVAGDETGIVVAALGRDGRYYVLEDASARVGPSVWPERVRAVYSRHEANVVVAEANQGGDMVKRLLEGLPVVLVRATRGKAVRAEPVAALYRLGRVSHVGVFPELEAQMLSWRPQDKKSPDRMDALVWALTYLQSAGHSRWSVQTWGA